MAKKEKSEEKKLVDFIGETICMESALLAASINLMRAGDLAKETSDVEGLIKVANAWYDLGRFLSGPDEEPEQEKQSNPIGFLTTLETLDDPGDEPDQGESGTEVCS
jgi:hypothetical protein